MNLESYKAIAFPTKTTKAYQAVLNFINRFYIPLFVMLCGVLFFLCFYHLDVKWVNAWDEARHGVNAYEMYQNKEFIVNTYNYSNDYWNLKPPLSYWGIMLGFKLFGFQVFSLRFYSALCYFITCVVASLYVKRSSKLASLLTMGLFCAGNLAFVAHMARAGDADSMYIMFFTFAMLAMMLVPQNKKMLYVSGFCFALAFLTKSWHSGMIVVIGGLYLLVTGEIKKVKPKEWILFLLSFIIPLLIWAIARFASDGTAFFYEMLHQDLLNRTKSGIEGHEFPFSFYFDYIFKGYYPDMAGDYTLISKEALLGQPIYQVCFILCIVGAIFFNQLFHRGEFKKFLGYLLWFFVPFLAFSISKTKLIWYIYPTLIPLIMIAGIYGAKLLNSEKILFKVKWLLLITTTLLLVKYTSMNITHVSEVEGDDFQSFIRTSVERDSSYAGSYAYLYTGESDTPLTNWTQDNLFLGEISGDYRCLDGGIEDFLLTADNSVLYISAVYYDILKDDELKDYPVVYHSDEFYLLTNR